MCVRSPANSLIPGRIQSPANLPIVGYGPNFKRASPDSRYLLNLRRRSSVHRPLHPHHRPQVKKLLADDPGNSEYADMEKELVEVIALTEELLVTTRHVDYPRSTELNEFVSPSERVSQSKVVSSGRTGQNTEEYHKFAVGDRVQAVWSEDGEWYDATIEALTVNGYFVCYDSWGNKEEVDHDNVRQAEGGDVNALVEAEKQAEATKQAIKRKVAQAGVMDFQQRTIPPKLRIDPTDTEDVKAAKRKKIHAFKSKARFEQFEVVQNKRQNSWQQFQSTKGKTKKVGFFSGRKRDSIFKSPDDPMGKVGVTGSGKGLTEFQKREKHLHLKGASTDVEDEL